MTHEPSRGVCPLSALAADRQALLNLVHVIGEVGPPLAHLLPLLREAHEDLAVRQPQQAAHLQHVITSVEGRR